MYLFCSIGVLGVLLTLAARPARCPECGQREVRMWAALKSDPGPSLSFYRCEHCGLRLMRVQRGAWEDASAIKYDRYYAEAPPLPLRGPASYRRRG